MTRGSHYKTVCKYCFNIISQCRCIVPDKNVEYKVCCACEKELKESKEKTDG